MHFGFLISRIQAIKFHNLGFPCLFYEIQFCRPEYTLHPKQAHRKPLPLRVWCRAGWPRRDCASKC
ncbi:hypothetical protein CBM2609_B70284 [Cupriavidus taiwanensis]|nr:hypothetical protein CBM2604_B60282 [Cupriavidus taiwanensis]SOZ33340.1 hypothetical protein CBM2609_B70284 [Cupriavidus taiwanensis]SOZ48655.1 hypothetical protein CBM2610_B50284 [Cupriavidus taiwanensis]